MLRCFCRFVPCQVHTSYVCLSMSAPGSGTHHRWLTRSSQLQQRRLELWLSLELPGLCASQSTLTCDFIFRKWTYQHGWNHLPVFTLWCEIPRKWKNPCTFKIIESVIEFIHSMPDALFSVTGRVLWVAWNIILICTQMNVHKFIYIYIYITFHSIYSSVWSSLWI